MTAMTPPSTCRSQEIRAKLGHPVVDGDGHYQELLPVYHDYLLDYVREVGGGDLARRFEATGFSYGKSVAAHWYAQTVEERRHNHLHKPAWWGANTETLERATVTLPKLMYERLPELGIDFSVLYPSTTGVVVGIQDPELRQATTRAVNMLNAELYAPYQDRLTPAALIPMHTPEEAIAELSYVVEELGLKTLSFRFDHVRRPISAVSEDRPDFARFAFRLDTFGVDSDYDYDPFWQACLDLGVAPASHASSQGWGSRTSSSNYVYNHIGNFHEAGHTLCKSMFLSGVTRRFPDLRIAFLEGGVAWACNLYSDLISHWEKRNGRAILALDPERLNRDEMVEMVRAHGYKRATERLDRIKEAFEEGEPTPPILDEFEAVGLECAEDIRDLFVPRFFFGCEADDAMNTWAFNTEVNPFGAKLGAFFGSDIGHWDVPDANKVVEEAYELVERKLMTEENFRDFMFVNPVRFYASANPDFFKGTSIETEAQRVLSPAQS